MKNKRRFWMLAFVPVAALVWAMRSAASWRPTVFGVQKGATDLNASPDGKLLSVRDRDGVQLWDVESKRPLWKSADGWLLFSPDSQTVMVEHTTSVVDAKTRTLQGVNFELHTARTGKLLCVFRDVHAAHDTEDGNDLLDCAFSPDGREFRVASVRKLRRFDVASGRLVKSLSWPSRNGLHVATFTSDGKILAFDEEEGLPLFDARTGKQLRRLPPFSGDKERLLYEHLQVAPDNSSFLRHEPREDSNKLFRVKDGRHIAHLSSGLSQFSSDGQFIYLTNHLLCRVFDAHTGRRLRELPGPMGEHFTPSPDGNWLYEARSGKIWKWRAR